MNAQLRYHYRIDPEALSDEEFYKLWGEYAYARKKEREFYIQIGRQLLKEAFGK